MKGYISVVGWLVGWKSMHSLATRKRRGGGGGEGYCFLSVSVFCSFSSFRSCVCVCVCMLSELGPTGCHTTYGTAKRMDRNERVYMDSTRS